MTLDVGEHPDRCVDLSQIVLSLSDLRLIGRNLAVDFRPLVAQRFDHQRFFHAGNLNRIASGA